MTVKIVLSDLSLTRQHKYICKKEKNIMENTFYIATRVNNIDISSSYGHGEQNTVIYVKIKSRNNREIL